MGSVPFAFSVHHFVSSVGADAGFAAIIGLAVLVLLYFAQARETNGLREQAYEAAQRVEQLEARLAQLSRQAPAPAAPPVAAAPAPARRAANSVAAAAVASPARVPVAAGVGASLPWAPAGVGAPALSAATRLIPVSQARAGATVARAAPPRAPEATKVGAPAPAPATVAGATNGVARERVSPAPVGVRSANQPPRAPTRPSPPADAPRRPLLPPPPGAPQSRSPVRRVLAVLVGVLLAAGVVAVLLIVTSSGSGSHPTTSASRTTNAPAPHRRVVSFNPGKVTVTVLNGTVSTGLAGRTLSRLTSMGYKRGSVATASDQTRTSTVVAYLPGYRSDALKVAGSLKLSPVSVQPIDQTAQQLACPPPSACTANVVVTVGSDLASP